MSGKKPIHKSSQGNLLPNGIFHTDFVFVSANLIFNLIFQTKQP
jgi:hypothetical protein